MRKVFLLIAIVGLFIFQTAQAQDEAENKSYVDFSANFQTNHLWRGLVITDKPMFAVTTNFNLDKEGKFTAGFWGGMSISNENDMTHYKEIDGYIQYATDNFSIGLWDLFNTRGVPSPDIGNYKHDETGHLLDLRTSFKLKALTVEADILLYGSGDTEPDRSNVKQRYSTYIQLSYPVLDNDKINMSAFAGAGIALNGETHLYGDGENSFDLVNMGITASKTIKIGDFNLPVSATTMLNPVLRYARVQLGIALF
ncbi:MAG: hypothetical protein CSA05_02260 [Bacteroidia bacterium]|nr:MAG: hypothetical protein CSA05_02260 [Bacteroidia bacterium]